MKIVIGVCGFGYGHSLRQSVIVNSLRRRGHSVAVFAFAASRAFFERHFREVPCFEVILPWIPGRDQGLDFRAGAEHLHNRQNHYWTVNFEAMARAEASLGGSADLVISDYCPVSASYGYAISKPVVTIDNQSKFMGYQFPDIGGFSRQEERNRLSLFIPRADARLATSFFQVPWPEDPVYPVTVVPSLIRPSVSALRPSDADERFVVTYLSPYGATHQTIEDTVQILRSRRAQRFAVFARDVQEAELENVTVVPFHESRFLENLARASGVITNAGSNVLCEALLLGKPVLALPFSTYEQNCNATVIADGGFGMKAGALTAEVLGEFVSRLPDFADRIRGERREPRLLQMRDGTEQVMALLHTRFGV